MKKVFLLMLIFIMACAVNSVCASDNIDNTTIGNDLIQNDASIRVDEFSHADILQNRASDNMDIKNSESLINDTSSSDNNKISSVLDSNNVNNITSDNKTSDSNTNGANIKPHLDIKGPKINGPKLDIKCPKIDNPPNIIKSLI